jgi:hypothetical protein
MHTKGLMMMLRREDYKAIKRMDKKRMEEYLKRVYMRGYEAGRRSLTVSARKSQKTEQGE